jgi:hypothetical protein
MTGHRMSSSQEQGTPRRRSGPKPPRRSMVQRLEERWQRRQDER